MIGPSAGPIRSLRGRYKRGCEIFRGVSVLGGVNCRDWLRVERGESHVGGEEVWFVESMAKVKMGFYSGDHSKDEPYDGILGILVYVFSS
ncbi:hypothetical protein BHE74_00039210 [Ensete ventricosum]|nr:hypothetical protein BHE74_00039210 [Ensete ventricosum]